MKLKETDIEVGYLYQTSSLQYRAILSMKGEFLIYAPSLEGVTSLESMPFENQPFKKCQVITFGKKDYHDFEFNGVLAIKHKLNNMQLKEITAQCNAQAAITALMA